ncbi:MAG: hypothetical protein CMO01_15530 [Thalassobius sp.]|nr:hypothetical protein [Thalassovita sp.]
MKTIEELSLNNMVVIEKYLNDQMTEDEKISFLKQMEKDKDLREDFEMAREVYIDINIGGDFKANSDLKIKKGLFELPVFSINRKKNLGEKITKDSLLAIIAAIMMVIVCLVIVYSLS